MRVISDMHKLVGGADEMATITVRRHVESWLKAKDGELADASKKFFRGSAQRFLKALTVNEGQCLEYQENICTVSWRIPPRESRQNCANEPDRALARWHLSRFFRAFHKTPAANRSLSVGLARTISAIWLRKGSHELQAPIAQQSSSPEDQTGAAP